MSGLGLSIVALTGLVLAFDVSVLGLRPISSREVAETTTPVQSGLASWYGVEEQGKLTADGERFDRNKFTAASRKLPFNTMVRVTNRENGRSVEVRINDRGPYVKNRVLDLSEAAAKALDMKQSGVTPVKIDRLDSGEGSAAPLAPQSTLP
jgi:rare lipoprotein A